MPVAVVPRRLGAPTHPEHLPDCVTDGDHVCVTQQAVDWQSMAGNANLWEVGATHNGAEENRAYELVGVMASTGEQLALALAAAVEVALWRDVRNAAAQEMCMRAMAESQCLFVIGAGHGLANVAVRTLCLHAGLRGKLAEALEREESQLCAPFSQARADSVAEAVISLRQARSARRG